MLVYRRVSQWLGLKFDQPSLWAKEGQHDAVVTWATRAACGPCSQHWWIFKSLGMLPWRRWLFHN